MSHETFNERFFLRNVSTMRKQIDSRDVTQHYDYDNFELKIRKDKTKIKYINPIKNSLRCLRSLSLSLKYFIILTLLVRGLIELIKLMYVSLQIRCELF